jgi:hypothetical protein
MQKSIDTYLTDLSSRYGNLSDEAVDFAIVEYNFKEEGRTASLA